MGHTRLGQIPTSQKWTEILGQIDALAQPHSPESLTATIAGLVLYAVEEGLQKAIADAGVRHTFYLLTQIALASRNDNWQQRLQPLGIDLGRDATIFDLTSELHAAIDAHLAEKGGATDFSEMAQRAAGEILTKLSGWKPMALFETNGEQLRGALRAFSTRDGFAELGRGFFATFASLFLNFYLSRVTAAKTGGALWKSTDDVTRFNLALRRHCHESALIVRDYCGMWYSKTNFKEGINQSNASRCVTTALRKLQSELRAQRVQE